MKTASVITCAVLLVGIGITSCSARTSTPSQHSSNTDRIQRLEQVFNNPQSSEFERLGAASELVRLGARNPKYWSHVRREGDTSLRREKAAAHQWQNQQTVASASTVERLAVNRDPINATASLAGSGIKLSDSNPGKINVTGYTQNRSVDERKPDLSNLPGIMALAASKHPDTLPDLRKAVEGDNVFIAAEAALGLANLKDHESIPKIVDAADRFDQGFLFARALVYFGTTNADHEAELLLRDKPKLLRELQATAKARGYEPFGTK